MAEALTRALSLLNIRRENSAVVLKPEQETAINNLLNGRDVMAILPTGFGKSMIYTVFALAKEEISSSKTCVIVIAPLKSIIDDQISEMLSLNCTAMELTTEALNVVRGSPPQFLYCSAETVLEKAFLAALKEDSALHRAVSAIVVDESHTVEAWTGKRKKQSRGAKPVQVFRGAYGKLAILRSMCKDGIPLLALTGTADKETEKTVINELAMKDPVKLFVSPNRCNLRLSINKVGRIDMLKQLDWIVEMIKTNGKETPKFIVFCDTMYSIASVFNYLMMSLGEKAFHPSSSRQPKNCLIAIFQSLSHKEYKDRLLNSFKNNGLKRIAIATTALSMGVNFPDVRYVVMYGPARSLLDFHQEAGRAGRDGLSSDIVLYFYGQQLAHCEEDVRDFLKTSGCYRIASYKTFDPEIASLSPSHDCCNFCAVSCVCGGSNGCTKSVKPFERKSAPLTIVPTKCRNVSDEERSILNAALSELQESHTCSAFGYCHGFSKELVSDCVANCHKLFTLEDITTTVPVFSKRHALKILEILNEIFNDIDESTLTDPTNSFCEEFITGVEELLLCDYTDFEDHLPDPDALLD